MNPVKVKAVVVVETIPESNGLHAIDVPISVHISRNPMWSASLHIKALKRKHPDREYRRFRVDALIARSSELADKIHPPLIADVLEQAFNKAKLHHPPI